MKECIHSCIAYYESHNPEALETTNGNRVIRPTSIMISELKLKKEKFGNLKEEDQKLLDEL